jgi:hypothetical protein
MSDKSHERDSKRKRSERRTSSRYRLSQPPEVEILHSETIIKARLGDLSRGGCYVETDCLLPEGTEITITLKKNGEHVMAQARIVRAFPNVGLALAFTSMDGDGFRILDSWLSAFVASTWVIANRRRTQRVAMEVEVRVSGYNPEGTRFTVVTNTVEISAFGGSVMLQTMVHPGQRLVLSNLKTRATVECMVVHCGEKGASKLVAFAFVVPNQSFWPVAFPPVDWTPHGTEAKRSGS